MEEAVAHHRLVAAEAVEGQVGQSAGLPDADAVLDSGVAPMAQLESRDVGALRIGDEAGVASPGMSAEE
jgi:hypothetical protein